MSECMHSQIVGNCRAHTYWLSSGTCATGAALGSAADCEQLLTDSVDFDAMHIPSTQPHLTVGMPSGGLACLPEASDLPSPDDVPVRKSDWNVLESREWRSAAEEERPATAPQFGAALPQTHAQSVNSPMAAGAAPLTSTFDVHAALASVRFFVVSIPHTNRPNCWFSEILLECAVL